MLNLLYQMNNMQLFAFLSGLAIGVSVIAVFIVNRLIPTEISYKDNSVIGNVSSLISLIYGVLAGLTALYLINNINYTSDAIQHEANAAANIYRDSKWLHEPARTQIQGWIKGYLNTVINVEWPAMEEGKNVSSDGITYIEKITNELVTYQTAFNTESLLLHDMLDEIKSLYNARENRIHMSFSSLNPEMWVVIIIGTILTIAINYLYGMNFYLKLISVSAAALMASSMIFLLLALDRPFQGEFIVEPDALRSVIKMINAEKTAPQKNVTPEVIPGRKKF